MKSIAAARLAASLALPVLCHGFDLTEDDNSGGRSMAGAIFSGPGIDIVNWDKFAALGAVGTFEDGPFGIGNGAILTTGELTGALPEGDRDVDNRNGDDGSLNYYCDASGKNAAVIYTGLMLQPGYNGLRIEFIFATNEADDGNPDTISILNAFTTTTQLAKFKGQRITAQSLIAMSPNAISPPDSVTGYARSTPPLVLTIPGSSESQIDLYFAVCDSGDGQNDSAFLIKGYACTDCELTPDGPEVNYVKQTTTLERGETPYTQTIPASDTTSGTFIYFVAPEETTTTTAAEETTLATTTNSPIDATTETAPESTTTAETSTAIESTGTTTAAGPDTTTKAVTSDQESSTDITSDQTTTRSSPCRPRRRRH
ncbi:hypothetical protein FHETE_6947 [Fusarium heterosporum]|uniref:Uncharacterized protein n=1 Tax=Fusarium heterosporum TaxID=42747 RepID=A0A8H5T4V6_FUSHE|nr:hypothetical protein FHETE_6947 [Fusarium heterosporum]